MEEFKSALFVNYSEDSFTDWGEKVGAAYGPIAVCGSKLIKQWTCPVSLGDAEKELRLLGYTIGVDPND